MIPSHLLSASDPPGAAIMWGRESPFVGLEGLSEERGRDCISLWHGPKQLDVSLWNAALPSSSFFFFLSFKPKRASS